MGGRYHIIPQLAVYTTYIPLIYCQLGDYISPIPPIKGTRNSYWLDDRPKIAGHFFRIICSSVVRDPHPFRSQSSSAKWKGNNPRSWGLTITMAANYLLNGMILPAPTNRTTICWYTKNTPIPIKTSFLLTQRAIKRKVAKTLFFLLNMESPKKLKVSHESWVRQKLSWIRIFWGMFFSSPQENM